MDEEEEKEEEEKEEEKDDEERRKYTYVSESVKEGWCVPVSLSRGCAERARGRHGGREGRMAPKEEDLKIPSRVQLGLYINFIRHAYIKSRVWTNTSSSFVRHAYIYTTYWLVVHHHKSVHKSPSLTSSLLTISFPLLYTSPPLLPRLPG
jgi:hypothetical protein